MLRPVTVPELLAVEHPENTIIGGDLLDAGGLMLVVGPTSVGKSYLLLQIAMHLAAGTALLGWSVPHPFRTCLVQAEIGLRRFQQRVAKLWANFPASAGAQLLLDSPYELKLDTAIGLDAVEAVVREAEIDVLIIDPLRPFHTRDENKSDEMQRLFDSFLRLQFKYGVAIIFGHHDRKPSADTWGKSIYETRGNTIITDRPDTVLRLKPVKGGLSVDAVWEKARNRDSLPENQRWVGDRRTGLFTPAVVQGAGDLAAAVTKRIPSGGIALNTLIAGLQADLGLGQKVAYAAVAAMEECGAIQKTASGRRGGKLVTLT